MDKLIYRFELKELGRQIDERIWDIQPLVTKTSTYLAITEAGNVFEINTVLESIEMVYSINNKEISFDERVSLDISPNNKIISVVNSRGRYGSIIDLEMKKEIMQVSRDNYHFDQTEYPIAFFEFNNETLLVHGTKWNRLDISDVSTGKLLTSRKDPEVNNMVDNGPVCSDHYLDYFHGRLLVSSNYEWLIDNGWEWHPYGSVSVLNINDWILNNIWESEDGASKKTLWWGKENWNEPICWISDNEVGIVGRFDYDCIDEDNIHDYTNDLLFRSFDVRDGKELNRFTIAPGKLFFDEYLFCSSQAYGVRVYDINTGNEIFSDDSINALVYNRTSKEFLSMKNNKITICKFIKNN